MDTEIKPETLEARANGICTKCKVNPAQEGYAYCERCREYDNNRPKRQYKKKKQHIMPQHVMIRVAHDLKGYMKENMYDAKDMGAMFGCLPATVNTWLKGKFTPRPKYLQLMREKGITDVMFSIVDRNAQAVSKKLVSIDKGNYIPRAYKHKVSMPDIVVNQIKLLLDEYIDSLDTPLVYAEFKSKREEFITKLFYTCTQGR